MTSTMMMDRTGMGVQGVSGVPTPASGVGASDPRALELADGAALHLQVREVPGRHEGHLRLRRPDGAAA